MIVLARTERILVFPCTRKRKTLRTLPYYKEEILVLALLERSITIPYLMRREGENQCIALLEGV